MTRTGPERVVGVVQARIGSRRLPGKMMMLLQGTPIIEWVFRRLQTSSRLHQTVFAIPDTAPNEGLAKHLSRLGATLFRGDEADVLDRIYQAAKRFEARQVVRICADNPFISGSEVDRLVDFFLREKCDYAYNHVPRNNRYPDGLGAEIASFETLELIYREAREPDHREHVFKYIWAFPERFGIRTFDPVEEGLRHPELKLDLDTREDYEKLNRLKVRIEMSAAEIVRAALQGGA